MAAVGAEMKRPAEGDGSVSPRKRARQDYSEPEEVASEGEVSDGVDEGEVDSDEDVKGPEEAGPGPATTWNSGVTNKLRTSFGTLSQPTKLPHKPETGLDTQPQLSAEVCDGLAAALRADENRTGSPLTDQGFSWVVPAFRADTAKGSTWPKVFDSMFSEWCPRFVAANKATVDQVGLGGDLLKKAFGRRLKGAPSLSPGHVSKLKKQLKQRYKETQLEEFAPGFKPGSEQHLGKGTRKEAEDRAKENIEPSSKKTPSQENPAGAQPSRQTKGQETTSPDTNDTSSPSADIDLDDSGEMSEGEVQSTGKSDDNSSSTDLERDPSMANPKNGSSQLPTEEELEQRHHYYPSLPDDAVFCLTCASYDHTTADCPETTCSFCQEDHFSYQCPLRQRCGKCKQLGHAKSSCKEKLAVAAGEGFIECAFCQAQDHQEENCTEIWQTYRPQVGHTKKVRSMPIFCYCCGAEGHFGSDCGLANPRLPHSETWTLATASLYLDPASSEDAVAFKSALPHATVTPLAAPVIPGRSIKPQSHIIFEDSGDEADDQNFIRAPAAGPKRSGQIQITSNINFGAPAGPSAQQGGGGQEGPMDVRQRRRQRQQQHKASQQQSSLPPKPVFAQQKRNGPPSLPPAPVPASKKGKKKGKGGNKPPLPPGPPPGSSMPQNNGGWRPQELMPHGQHDQQRGGNRGRGRGGFSSLGRGGGRGGRGRRNN